MRDDRADRRIDDGAADRPAGVHPVGGGGVLVDDVVVHANGSARRGPAASAVRFRCSQTCTPADRRRDRRRKQQPATFFLASPLRLGSKVSIWHAPPPSQRKMQARPCRAAPRRRRRSRAQLGRAQEMRLRAGRLRRGIGVGSASDDLRIRSRYRSCGSRHEHELRRVHQRPEHVFHRARASRFVSRCVGGSPARAGAPAPA